MSIKIKFGEEMQEINLESLSVKTPKQSNEPIDASLSSSIPEIGEVGKAIKEEI